jgi:hypothetical protein
LLARAFKYSDKSYEAKFELITFEQFKVRCSNPIRATLIRELTEMRGLKYFVSIKVQFSKIAMRQNEEVTTITTPFIRTKTIQVLNEDEIIMDDIFTKLTDGIAHIRGRVQDGNLMVLVCVKLIFLNMRR